MLSYSQLQPAKLLVDTNERLNSVTQANSPAYEQHSAAVAVQRYYLRS